jgi:UDP-N-acetylglucosamine acyltransferase
MAIHPTAVIHPSVELGEGVEVGAGVIIDRDVQIGDRTRIDPHVVIQPFTRLGCDCHVHSGAVLGGPPQDHKFKGERSFLHVGDRNILREYVTIHRARGEDERTILGDDNMIMAYCHIGHNCLVGNNVMMANYTGISGHVVVEDRVMICGHVGVHQFVRIGRLAMIGGCSKVVQDIPPFMIADGRPCKVYGLNVVGLRRNGILPRVRAALKQAYKYLYRSDMNLAQAMEAITAEVEPSVERDYLLEFLDRVRFGYGGRGNDQPRI